MGVADVAILFIKTGIALSGVILGLAVLFAVKPPIWITALIVGSFAIYHGHTHGTELSNAANP